MADETTPETQQKKDEKPRSTRRVVIAALVALCVFAVFWPVFSALQPAYYERYPALRSRMVNWRGSTHSVWSCAACHVGPGLENQASFALKSIPAFYEQIVAGPNETNLLGLPTNQACQQCHTAYRTVSPGGDLRIPHRAHVLVLKLKCVMCHQRLVHYRNVEGYNRPKMTFCLASCHNGKKATDKCAKCHTQKQVPPNHKHRGWLATHGRRTAEINCGTCHGWAPRLCQACHVKRPTTHRGNWKKLHRVRARERGKGCLFCHGGKPFCLKCHDKSIFNRLKQG